VKIVTVSILVLGLGAWSLGCGKAPSMNTALPVPPGAVELSPPSLRGEKSLEESITLRRSIREYAGDPLPPEHLAQLLWAAAGKMPGADVMSGATRPAPSAGATHPLEVYVVTGEVETILPGVYHYDRDEHSLRWGVEGDLRAALAQAALGQAFIGAAPATVILAADYGRTTGRYGQRGTRYVHMEAGGVTQSLCLQAASLGLGCVVVGAFDDKAVKDILGILEEPLLLVPVGWPAP
jgi:SagB-type dehydrogenase family enzyme